MKRVFCILICVVLFILLCACQFWILRRGHERRLSTYGFPNRNVSIEKVELILNQNPNGEGINESKFVLLKELTASETVLFMSKVYELDTKYFGPPPPWGYGTYIARVFYENGDIEMLGSLNIEFIEEGTEATGCGEYCFVVQEFENLFKQFVDFPAD